MNAMPLYLVTLGLILAAVNAAVVPPTRMPMENTTDAKPDAVLIRKEIFIANPEDNDGYFQGDIDPMSRYRSIVGSKLQLWKLGILYYKWHAGVDSMRKAVILEAMALVAYITESQGKTCLSFKLRTAKIEVYSEIFVGDGCFASVGTSNKIFAPFPISIGYNCEKVGIITHELIHALGFHHEQTRMDRDNYVKVHEDNIRHDRISNYDKLTYFTQLIQELPYDFGSIMHYGPYDFARDVRKPTMTILPSKNRGERIGQRELPSITDVTELQLLYQCKVDTSNIKKKKQKRIMNCSFQNSDCGMRKNPRGQFMFTRTVGSSASSNSTPKGDASSGNGVYMLASASNRGGQVASMNTRIMQMSGLNCISLRFGTDGGGSKLGILLQNAQTGEMTDSGYMKMNRRIPTQWVYIREEVEVRGPHRIIFEAGIDDAGRSDVSLDDIVVYEGGCIDY